MENNSYSVKESAGKSLRTFLLTLSVSLIVFSAVYYVLTTNVAKDESFQPVLNTETSSNDSEQKTSEDSNKPADVAGAQTSSAEQASIFGKLAETNPGVQSRVVLSGSTVNTPQTTTSAGGTPDTGNFGLTVGLFTAFALFVSSMVLVSKNPRKLALNAFEKNATKGVDKN